VKQKTLVTICGAAIAASLFLPWLAQPATSPWDLMKDTDWAKLAEAPPLKLAFLATFVLGAIAALLAVVGWAPRLLALVTAVLPFGLAGYVWLEAKDMLAGWGVTLPVDQTLSGIGKAIPEIAGIGFYFWAGGAALLLLVALLDSGERY
jgi:hypothetical protein